MSVLMLLGALIAPLLGLGVPGLALGSSVVGAALPAEAAAGAVAAGATPTAVPHLALWQFPTATPVPAPATPAAHAGQVRGPGALALWTGDRVAVEPASSERRDGVYHWLVPEGAAGWHTTSADCGRGLTVIGGHVSYNGRPGVFAALAGIGEGDTVTCRDAGGEEHRFAPVDYLVVPGQDDPATWTPTWSPALLLYTCTPQLNGQLIVVRFEEMGTGP